MKRRIACVLTATLVGIATLGSLPYGTASAAATSRRFPAVDGSLIRGALRLEPRSNSCWVPAHHRKALEV